MSRAIPALYACLVAAGLLAVRVGAPMASGEGKRVRPYRKLAPTVVTLAGLLAGLLGAWLLAADQPIAALCWLGAGQLCDLLDGWLARRLDAVTDFGGRLDWSSDCAVAVSLYVALGWWPAVAVAALLHAFTWPRGAAAPPRVSGRSAAVLLAFASAAVGAWV